MRSTNGWCTALMNYWTDNMSAAITNEQRKEISHLEYVFSSIQVRGNRLLIHGELYQRTLKQDVLRQRPSSLASKNICVNCLAIVRLKLTKNRRPKHSLWVTRDIFGIVKRKSLIDRHSKSTEDFIGHTSRFPSLFNCRVPAELIGSRAFGSLIIRSV